jgi:hypothetical protein
LRKRMSGNGRLTRSASALPIPCCREFIVN